LAPTGRGDPDDSTLAWSTMAWLEKKKALYRRLSETKAKKNSRRGRVAGSRFPEEFLGGWLHRGGMGFAAGFPASRPYRGGTLPTFKKRGQGFHPGTSTRKSWEPNISEKEHRGRDIRLAVLGVPQTTPSG